MNDSIHGGSDRDELARELSAPGLRQQLFEGEPHDFVPDYAADVLWAAGWRKVPSREALQQVLIETGNLSPAKKHRHAGEMADAILALINGDCAESSLVGNGERKETGEK